MEHNMKFLVGSDKAVCVEFGNEISEEVNNRVRAFTIIAEQADISGITELVPTYRSVTVHYLPEVIGYIELCSRLSGLLDSLGDVDIPAPEVVHVPVLYGGEEYGPDLAYVADVNGLTEEQVIAIHSEPEYLIYMLGFTPGFCYLGGMDERIATPRLTSPRVKIPAGSVGIAGSQTGIYPVDSPGGWRLIGHSPLKLYDPDRERPILFDAGMKIKFYAIGQEEYHRLCAENCSKKEAAYD